MREQNKITRPICIQRHTWRPVSIYTLHTAFVMVPRATASDRQVRAFEIASVKVESVLTFCDIAACKDQIQFRTDRPVWIPRWLFSLPEQRKQPCVYSAWNSKPLPGQALGRCKHLDEICHAVTPYGRTMDDGTNDLRFNQQSRRPPLPHHVVRSFSRALSFLC